MFVGISKTKKLWVSKVSVTIFYNMPFIIMTSIIYYYFNTKLLLGHSQETVLCVPMIFKHMS